MKRKFKIYMLTTAVSYMIVTILQVIIFYFNKQDISNNYIILIFVICIIVNLLINITHYFEMSEWLIHIFSIVEITAVVSISNLLLNCKNNFLIILMMSAFVYFIVIAIVFVKNSEDAKKINEKLNKNRQCN